MSSLVACGLLFIYLKFKLKATLFICLFLVERADLKTTLFFAAKLPRYVTLFFVKEDRTGIAPSTAILTGRVESSDDEKVTETIIALTSKFDYHFVGELQFWAYYKERK